MLNAIWSATSLKVGYNNDGSFIAYNLIDGDQRCRDRYDDIG